MSGATYPTKHGDGPRVHVANLDGEAQRTQLHAVALVAEQLQRAITEVVQQVGHLADDAFRAQRGLFPDVGVRATHEPLDFVAQVARHFLRGDVGKCAQREANDVHIGVVHVAASVPTRTS